MRKTPPTWPQMLSPKGKLKEYVYNGAGWWFHVCNPDRPRAPLSLLDIQRIRDAIDKQNDIQLGPPTISSIGIIQIRICQAKGQGIIHFYTTRHGRSDGNARLSLKGTSELRTTRSALLSSEWFHDAQLGAITPHSMKAEVIYEKEGKMILPPLLPSTPAKSLREVFKTIRDNLGKKGKAAMKKYITASGLQEGSAAMDLLKEIFKGAPKDEGAEKDADPPGQQH